MSIFVFLQEIAFSALGPMYLSAMLKKHGHECHLFIEELEKDLLKKVKETKPDYIAFSTFTGQHVWALKWAKKIKEKLGIPIIFGGPHVTHYPSLIEKHDFIDVVCIGEAEYPFLELADAIDSKKGITEIKNLWVRKDKKIYKNEIRNLIEDLDELPFPDRDLYYKYKVFRNRDVKRFLASRGCPYDCIFCHNHTDKKMYIGKGKWARKRSPESVIEEIEEVKNKYSLRVVVPVDDHFLDDNLWASKFLKLYKEKIGLDFVINTRPESINEEIVIALKKANCKGVAISVESGDEKLRNVVLKKYIKDEEIINAARLLNKYKINFKTFNMIGVPEETLDMAFKTLHMSIKLKPIYARCSLLSPYPDTDLYRLAEEKNLIDKDFDMEKYTKNYMEDSLLKIPNQDRFVNLQKFFSLTVAFPFLLPIVKQLIKLPPNKIYDKISTLTFGYLGAKYFGYSLIDMIKTARSFIKNNHPP